MVEMNLYDYLTQDLKVDWKPDGSGVFTFDEPRFRERYSLCDLPARLLREGGECCERMYHFASECGCQAGHAPETGCQAGHVPETGCQADRVSVKLNAEYIKCLKSRQIRFDTDAWSKADISNVRRPFFMVRGRGVSHAQMKLLLKNELEMFRNPYFFKADKESEKIDGRYMFFSLNSGGFGKLLPDRHGSSGGWLWDTGEIGGSGWEVEYPDFDECMPQWLALALKYPFLDMPVGYTSYVEAPCYFCPLKLYYQNQGYLARACKKGRDPEEVRELEQEVQELEACVKSGDKSDFTCRGHRIPECESYFKKGDFWGSGKTTLGTGYADIVYTPELMEDVVLTVRICEGSLEVLAGEDAVRAFREYDAKYGFKDTWRYAAHSFGFFHELLQEALVTEETLRECLADEGMDQDACIEHLVRVQTMDLKAMQRGKPCIK